MTESVHFDLTKPEGHYDLDGFYRLSDFELVTGWVGGFEPPGPRPARYTERPDDPRYGFEFGLLEALQNPPCVVAFSGGRDSSAILAVATHVARREGLPEPIAASHDFSGHGDADEYHYQELLVRHLGLKEWHRFTDADAFDVLGERAREGLLRFGLLWPALIHCHAPFMELAKGGCLLVGEGGDEVLGNQRMTVITHLTRNRPKPDKHIREALYASLAPSPLRYHRSVRELASVGMHPWLRRDAANTFLRRQARDQTGHPLRWDDSVLRHSRRRALTTGVANTRKVLAAHDVAFYTPFYHPQFLHRLAQAGGARGFVTRTSMMRRFFGDVVPDAICVRDQKARFGAVAVGRPSREFLNDWHGEGVDPDVVDIEAFRQAAQADSPLFGTQLLLQAAWLAMQPAAAPAPTA